MAVAPPPPPPPPGNDMNEFKLHNSSDNSNCALLLSCENSHKNIGTAQASKVSPVDLPFCAGCWRGLGTAQDDDVFLPAVEV